MTVINLVKRLTAVRPFTTASKLVFRKATPNEADLITRRAVQEGWHISPYDFPSIFAFNPNYYYMGEVNGELACHIGIVEFPKHHYYGGGVIVSKKFRGSGYGTKCVDYGKAVCDPNYTLGTDIDISHKSKAYYESKGFKKYWDTYIAMFDLEKIVKNTAELPSIPGLVTRPIHSVNLDKLLEYDQKVFGTPREVLIKRWINIPGSLGWAAVSEKSDAIVGYAIVKQVIKDAGTKFGLAMTPLYADDAHIAKLLLKTAAESCLANDAIPKSKLEMFHPVGDICGEGADEMMDELGAELTHIAHRVYTKGIPPGRQSKKIYGILSPSCD